MSLFTKARPPEITSPLRDPRVTVRVGAWLGAAVLVCFLTGLLSHLHQHPVGWLPIPPRPAWGYRVTQGLHVASGIACVPLVLVKLFSVFPRLLEWPPVRSVPHALERLSVAGLVGAMLFEVVTGLLNVAQLYPWGFFFPSAHYAVAWVLVGSVLLHLAVKAPVIVEAWRARTTDDTTDGGPPETGEGSLTRRGLLVSTGAAVGAVTLVTIGQTVPGLSRFALLAPRRPTTGPQGFPVNKTARSAGVAAFATSPQWRLLVAGPAARAFSLAELAALPQQSVSLPIACVEGWSATVRWDGVRLADVLALTGLDPAGGVLVTSLEAKGLYGRSALTADQALDPRTLLALRANGETLALDHGFPLRLIAPNRPGVQQTKWLSRIEAAR
jgi:DMSO/TMAO reductase YedYZ molybdopterin-dependent catalytic subunit